MDIIENSQCGSNNNNDFLLPQLNPTLKNENIIHIKCGSNHSMVKNRNHNYYLWGHNGRNICLCSSNKPPEYVKKPLLLEPKLFINKYQEIIDIFLGTMSTRVLIGNGK